MSLEQTTSPTLDQAVTLHEVAAAFAYGEGAEARQVLNPSRPDDLVLLKRRSVQNLLENAKLPVSGLLYAEVDTALPPDIERSLRKLKNAPNEAERVAVKMIEDIQKSLVNISSKLKGLERASYDTRRREFSRLNSLFLDYIPRAFVHSKFPLGYLPAQSPRRSELNNSLQDLVSLGQNVERTYGLVVSFNQEATLANLRGSIERVSAVVSIDPPSLLDTPEVGWQEKGWQIADRIIPQKLIQWGRQWTSGNEEGGDRENVDRIDYEALGFDSSQYEYLRRLERWEEKTGAYLKKTEDYLLARHPSWQKDFPDIWDAFNRLYTVQRQIEVEIRTLRRASESNSSGAVLKGLEENSIAPSSDKVEQVTDYLLNQLPASIRSKPVCSAALGFLNEHFGVDVGFSMRATSAWALAGHMTKLHSTNRAKFKKVDEGEYQLSSVSLRKQDVRPIYMALGGINEGDERNGAKKYITFVYEASEFKDNAARAFAKSPDSVRPNTHVMEVFGRKKFLVRVDSPVRLRDFLKKQFVPRDYIGDTRKPASHVDSDAFLIELVKVLNLKINGMSVSMDLNRQFEGEVEWEDFMGMDFIHVRDPLNKKAEIPKIRLLPLSTMLLDKRFVPVDVLETQSTAIESIPTDQLIQKLSEAQWGYLRGRSVKVSYLQVALERIGLSPGSFDGYYATNGVLNKLNKTRGAERITYLDNLGMGKGGDTARAVMAYQRIRGFSEDGLAGEHTVAGVVEDLRIGNRISIPRRVELAEPLLTYQEEPLKIVDFAQELNRKQALRFIERKLHKLGVSRIRNAAQVEGLRDNIYEAVEGSGIKITPGNMSYIVSVQYLESSFGLGQRFGEGIYNNFINGLSWYEKYTVESALDVVKGIEIAGFSGEERVDSFLACKTKKDLYRWAQDTVSMLQNPELQSEIENKFFFNSALKIVLDFFEIEYEGDDYYEAAVARLAEEPSSLGIFQVNVDSFIRILESRKEEWKNDTRWRALLRGERIDRDLLARSLLEDSDRLDILSKVDIEALVIRYYLKPIMERYDFNGDGSVGLNEVGLITADFHAGSFSPRNAAVQQALSRVLGTSLILDGDLSFYDKEGNPVFWEGAETVQSLMKFSESLTSEQRKGLSSREFVESFVVLSNSPDLERHQLYSVLMQAGEDRWIIPVGARIKSGFATVSGIESVSAKAYVQRAQEVYLAGH